MKIKIQTSVGRKKSSCIEGLLLTIAFVSNMAVRMMGDNEGQKDQQ